MSLTACPSHEELLALRLGKLPIEVASQLGEHLDACRTCQANIETISDADDTFVHSLRQAPAETRFEQEPELRNALEAVKTLASGHSSPTRPETAGAMAAEPLGELRDYRLLEELGAGGMGTVYKALHARLKRIVALKVLSADRVRDRRAVARFEREMEAVGKLEHPNIVRALDAGEHEGTHYLVMEYVDGLDLSQLAKRRGPLPIADACELVRQAALGLEGAHERGLVHRDIKPSNLMLTPAGQVKVLDLGLALLAADQPGGDELTGASQMMGTADYCAPEQAGDSHAVDIRADLYSLGCALYKLLAGRVPFSGEPYNTTMKKVMAHINEPAPSVREFRHDAPDALVKVLDRALAKEPAERFATPGEFASAVAPFAVGADLQRLYSDAISGARSAPRSAVDTTSEIRSKANQPAELQAGLAVGGRAGGLPPRRRAAIAAVAALVAFAGIVVIVKNRNGETTAKIGIAAGGVKLSQGGRELASIESEGGEPATEIELAPDASATLSDHGKEIATIKQARQRAAAAKGATPSRGAAPKVASGAAARAPTAAPAVRAEAASNFALSGTALVRRPATLPGGHSWTLETMGHRGRVRAAAFSPDASRLASVSDDGHIRIFDRAGGRIERILVGGSALAEVGGANYLGSNCLAWSPDGRMLALGDKQGAIRVWDAATGIVTRRIDVPQPVLSLAWSPDSARLASAADALRVDSIASGEPLWTASRVAFALAWSPDGSRLAVGNSFDSKTEVAVYDALVGRETVTIAVPGETVRALAYSRDGEMLAIARRGGLHFWNAASGELTDINARNLERNGGGYLLAWGPLGETVYLDCWGNGISEIHRLEADSKESSLALKLEQAGYASAATISADGTLLAAGGLDGSVRIWKVSSGELLHASAGHASILQPIGEWGSQISSAYVGERNMAWSNDGARLAASGFGGSLDGRIHVLDVATGDELLSLEWEGGPILQEFSPDGTRLMASAGYPLFAKVWDGTSGEPVRELAASRYDYGDIDWSPDGTRIAIGGKGKAAIFNAATGELAQEIKIGDAGDETAPIRFSPSGRRIAAAAYGKPIAIYDLSSGERIQSLGEIGIPLWSPDEKQLAIGMIGKVRIWDVSEEQFVDTLEGRDGVWARPLAWTEKGGLCAQFGKELRWWNAQGRPLAARVVEGQALLSPNLAVAAILGTSCVQLWDVDTSRSIATIVVLRNGRSLIVSPEGHYRSKSKIERELAYVVETEAGQQLLSPQEFEAAYGWKNVPEKVRLLGADKTSATPLTPRGAE